MASRGHNASSITEKMMPYQTLYQSALLLKIPFRNEIVYYLLYGRVTGDSFGDVSTRGNHCQISFNGSPQNNIPSTNGLGTEENTHELREWLEQEIIDDIIKKYFRICTNKTNLFSQHIDHCVAARAFQFYDLVVFHHLLKYKNSIKTDMK